MTSLPPDGLLLLTQPTHHAIDEGAARQSLRESSRTLPYRHLTAPVQVAMADLARLSWSDARRSTEHFWRDEVLPLLRDHPRWCVAYFGAAPIPLAMYLGHLIGSWQAVDVHQQHHVTHAWVWPESPAQETVTIKLLPAPPLAELVAASGDVVIRVTTWHSIDPEVTRALVPDRLAEIDIAIDNPGPDALATPADVELVADAVRRALDAVITFRPGAKTVHLFAAVPVGLAFRIGTLVSPTKHPRVQTWQYDRNATPPYRAAIALHDDGPSHAALSEGDRAAAERLRETWRGELARLGEFSEHLRESSPSDGRAGWAATLFPNASEVAASFRDGLGSLPALHTARLGETNISAKREALDGGFEYDGSARQWAFDDALLARIAARIADAEGVRQAGRMFLLHEAVHLAGHGLTTATSRRVGRFPKVVEEIDHQADVWAAFHDYAFTRHHNRKSTDDAPTWFRALIEVMLRTFWAFDDEGVALREFPIRRMNRYLLWYWLSLRLDHTRRLPDVARVFAERPWIELAGLPIITSGERVLYTLDPRTVDALELCVLWNNSMCRVGDAPAHPLGDLVAGFRERDDAKIRGVLRGVFDTVTRRP